MGHPAIYERDRERGTQIEALVDTGLSSVPW